MRFAGLNGYQKASNLKILDWIRLSFEHDSGIHPAVNDKIMHHKYSRTPNVPRSIRYAHAFRIRVNCDFGANHDLGPESGGG